MATAHDERGQDVYPGAPSPSICEVYQSKIRDSQRVNAYVDPHLGPLKPSGQPPTPAEVIKFTGSLQVLMQAASVADPGTVFDLDGKSIHAQVGHILRPSTLSAHSLEDLGTDGTDTPDAGPASAASNETAMAMFCPSHGQDLADVPQRASSELEPCESFECISDDTGTLAADGHSLGLSSTSGADAPATRGNTRLRAIASQASLRPRSIPDDHFNAGSLGDSACVRHSCSFNSKRLDDHLNPDGDVAPVICIRLGNTRVTLRNGNIVLPAGALLLLEQCKVTLEDMHVVGPAARSDTDSAGKSLPLVYVSNASVTLDGCTVGHGEGHGVGVGEGGTLVLRGCHVANHRTYGLVLRGDGSSADARGCTFECNGQDGVAVGSGAVAHIERSGLSRNSMLGLCVSAGGTATVVSCTLESNGTHGLSATGGAALEVRGSHISGCEAGVLALDSGTTVTVADCTLKQTEHGIHARDGAQVTVKSTRMERLSIGVLVTGAKARVEVSDSHIFRSRRMGVHVFGGASATLRCAVLSGSAEHGALVQHVHSSINMSECTVSSNGSSGVQSAVGATVEMLNCRLFSNIVAGAQVTDTSSMLKLEGCNLSENGTIGLFANKGSAVVAKACQLSGNGSSGCEIRDRGTRADVVGCTLCDNGRVGVYVHSAAAIDIEASNVTDNRSLAVLVGGRTGTDIGGGLVTYCADSQVVGGTKVRHGGRMYKRAGDDAESDDQDALQ